MQIYLGYKETTPANCCHVIIELLKWRLGKEGSVLLIVPYYTSEFFPVDVSCNISLKSIMKKHWVMDR